MYHQTKPACASYTGVLVCVCMHAAPLWHVQVWQVDYISQYLHLYLWYALCGVIEYSFTYSLYTGGVFLGRGGGVGELHNYPQLLSIILGQFHGIQSIYHKCNNTAYKQALTHSQSGLKVGHTFTAI